MNLLIVLSHDLIKNQVIEATEKLKIKNIINLPKELKEIWSNINPKGDLSTKEIDKILKWVSQNSSEGDYILIQGDFGAVFYLVDFCFKTNRVPIYATTYRRVKENISGDTVLTNRVFNHVEFRKYIKYNDHDE